MMFHKKLCKLDVQETRLAFLVFYFQPQNSGNQSGGSGEKKYEFENSNSRSLESERILLRHSRASDWTMSVENIF